MSRSLLLFAFFAFAPLSVRAQDVAPEAEVAAETSAVADDAEGVEGDDAEPAAPPVHDPTLMTIGLTTASIGVVSFAVLTSAAVVERGRVAAGCDGTCSAADRDGAEGLGYASYVSAGVALVGAALSLIGIAVMGRPEDDEPPAEREEEITVSVSPAGVLVSGTF
jgi:hypothetical protein